MPAVWRIVLFGPPGAGKGTQARMLGQRLGIHHISTGRILRGAVRQGSDIGRQVSHFLVKGLLVPDDLVRSLAEKAIMDAGLDHFLLDGYPRTIQQAKWLTEFLTDHGCALSAVLYLNLSDSDIIARLSRRRVDPSTGENYHLDHKPPPASIISQLEQRPDDKPDAIRRRLSVYEEDTAPVARYYRQAGMVHDIDASGAFETVHARIRDVLQLA